jgi:hypothetical protein
MYEYATEPQFAVMPNCAKTPLTENHSEVERLIEL